MTVVACTTCVGKREQCIRGFDGKPERKVPLGIPKHSSEDNINTDLKYMGGLGVDGIDLAPDSDKCEALGEAIMKFRVP